MRSKTIGLRWKKPSAHDSIDRLYHSSQWQNETSPVLRSLNPRCQVIHANGQRCKNPSAVVHHVVSPRADITKFFDFGNLVAICTECHGPEEGELPDSNRTFAPTKDIFGHLHHHERPKPLAQGEVRILADGTCQVG
jgi:hypothetical protein